MNNEGKGSKPRIPDESFILNTYERTEIRLRKEYGRIPATDKFHFLVTGETGMNGNGSHPNHENGHDAGGPQAHRMEIEYPRDVRR
jgi:hypothetical protein